ncbi:MAG: phosphoribosyltransferase catalytic subunit, partial [Firmicutes bacterium]|nr:phosphoribosyltransferase catalytic subunit [Bacillota bacterium]
MPRLDKDFLTIALPKGKLLIDSIQLLSRVGIECSHVNEDSRKLFYDLPDSK